MNGFPLEDKGSQREIRSSPRKRCVGGDRVHEKFGAIKVRSPRPRTE